mmetsp:Transcript_24716/g.32268  ORF Transcript_24716/g.32268 Transcript_24716/m.32268 type:complete len:85 (-) Transcript_24716:383-637(-)
MTLTYLSVMDWCQTYRTSAVCVMGFGHGLGLLGSQYYGDPLERSTEILKIFLIISGRINIGAVAEYYTYLFFTLHFEMQRSAAC